jgi:hypothetical protein
MSRAVDNSRPKKIRILALNSSGKPLARVRVELILTSRHGDIAGKKPENEPVALRSLSTSRDGFAIFSLAAVPEVAQRGEGLAVRFAEKRELTYAIDQAALRAGGNYLPLTLPDGPWLEAEPALGPWLDDGLEADDIWAVPGIFPDLGDLEFGDDRCGRLIPNDLTVRITNQNQVVRTAKEVVTCAQEAEHCPGCKGPIEQGSSGRDGEFRLHEGEMLHFEIRSTRLGYTFGDLLYSLPLAPCESVTLAISHWEQRQVARSEVEAEAQEKKNATYYRENALSEAMSAASANSHHGWAVMNGHSTGGGTSASGTYSTWLFKGAGALQSSTGVSASGTYDRSRFAANSTRSFSDRIQQSAEAWRRDHQVVVMEQSESEDHQVSYRTVCNNNHCHVLNLFYHEVLNNFRIRTKLLGHREVYLVPYKVKPLDLALALCKRPILLPFLLDGALAECYRDLKLAGSGQGPVAAAGSVDAFKIDLKIGMEIGFNDSDDFFLMIKTIDGMTHQFPVKAHENWHAGQSYSYPVDTTNFDPTKIHEVGILKILSPGAGIPSRVLQIESYTISVKDPMSGQWLPLGSGAAGPSNATLLSMVPASYAPAAAPGSAQAADTNCAERLLAHLNCNKAYYNSLLWLFEDPNERFCRFDSIISSANAASLAELIVNEPVAVMGCYVAFPKAGSDFIPYDDKPIVDERLLTLPTPGIFADAALGQCSACEKIDNEVYWNWKDSPCVCGGKDVSLKTPTDSSLIAAGSTPFLTLPTAVLAATVAPPSGEAATTNTLVNAFGGALATALLSGKNATSEIAALQDLLGKLTAALKDLKPDPGSGAGTGTGTAPTK